MKLSAKNECRALILAGCIFFAGGCLAIRPAWHSYQFRNSVPVPARILELGIKKTRKGSSTTARYTYSYSGIEYSSSSVSPASDRGRIYRQLMNTHEPLAYVDPNKPHRSYLDPVLPSFDRYASISFGMLFPLIGSSVAILGIKRLKAGPTRKNSRSK